jgi:hypothetical protein
MGGQKDRGRLERVAKERERGSGARGAQAGGGGGLSAGRMRARQ